MNHRLQITCRIGFLPVILILLSLTSQVQAHMTIEGAGDLGNGALHPLMTPAHVLILLGLGLLLGQQVPLDLKKPMLVFAPASAIALLLTTTGKITGVYQPVLTALALCAAILVAMEIRVPRAACAALCAAAAVGIGLDSGFDNGSVAMAVKTLLGTWVSMNVMVGYLALCASNAEGRQWAKTGIRIAGSWIIAISLMVLAFSLKKH